MTIYIVSTLAREIENDLVHQLIEFVSSDKSKAEKFFKDNAKQNVMSVNGIECNIQRGIIEAELNG